MDNTDALNTVAKAGYLKVETDIGDIKLNSHNSVDIQPKGIPFGTKLKIQENGDIIPTFTLDTKKLRKPKKKIDAKQILDDALEDFLDEEGV